MTLALTFGSALLPSTVLAGLLFGAAPAHAALVAPHAEGDAALFRLLRERGIRPVQPATPASDFRLPDLAGGERALSDFRGEWVVLTFFATWCGPCRSEMPTLERLHGELGERGLAVLGVSTDRDDAKLPGFLKQLGVTFPNLWDRTSGVARTYRATSIPLSYVIDPAGRVVGTSRGARDWGALSDLFTRSFEIYPPALGAAPAREEAPVAATRAAARVEGPVDGPVDDEATPLDLPAALEPPTAELELSDSAPRPGEPFYLQVKIHWAGNFDEYLLLPPTLAVPEGLRQLGTSAVTSSETGRNVVSYRLQLQADEPGRYALDPIELRYTPRFEQEPVASRIAGPTVTVARPTLLGMPRAAALTSLAAGGAALVLVAGLWLRRRDPAVAGLDPAVARFARLQGRFDEARAQRMRGDSGGCLANLAAIDEELGTSPGEEERARLARLIDDARYGGRAPAREQLDTIERRVERALEAIRPDPSRSERARAFRRVRSEPRRVATGEGFLPLTLEEPTAKDR